MIKQISIILILLSAAVFNVPAQTANDVYAVKNSSLSAIDLPPGAMRIREANVPKEVKTLLMKMIEAGGESIKQGESEVVIWTGKNFSEADNPNRIKQIENNLKNDGWEFETSKADESLFFSAINKGTGRALVGFIVPSDEAFLFAATEMLRNDAGGQGGKTTRF